MKYSANIYSKDKDNPTITNSDESKSNIGLCFSGGGSRAMTCAWGQMLGLSELNLMDKIRYISSVSGGTWASSIYTYLPDGISDDALLGAYYPPEKLSLSDDNDLGVFNINHLLDKNSLGQAPAGMHLDKLGLEALYFYILFAFSEHEKWLWASLVGKFILKPYKLQAKEDMLKHLLKPWKSTKQFSLSEIYAKENFPTNAPPLDEFYFTRDNRPFLIMNNNIMEKIDEGSSHKVNIVQLPNQVTPVAGGALGKTPDGKITGGGLVESYGVCSTLLNPKSTLSSPVDIEITQPYSLIDIVSTSSAFFAESIEKWLSPWFGKQMADSDKKRALIAQIDANLSQEQKEFLIKQQKSKSVEDFIEILLLRLLEELPYIVPSYNYWSVEDGKNQERPYTDGGTLDNTGVLGMLAQTDTGGGEEPIKLIVFDNTDTPLEKKNGKVIAGSGIAPLFGIDFNEGSGEYQPFTDNQKDYLHKDFITTSLITLFDNKSNLFDKLVNGLYNGNTQPAFYEIELITVDNTLAGVTGGREVNLLYIQNAKMMDWQDSIGDNKLKKEIMEGQWSHICPEKAFANFPYYSTFSKIGLEAKESNALSQMWAWAIADDRSSLKKQLQIFIGNSLFDRLSQKSKESLETNKIVLSAQCKKLDDSWQYSQLDITNLTHPDIANIDGVLENQGIGLDSTGYLPNGSFSETSQDIKVTLYAKYKDDNSVWQEIILDVTNFKYKLKEFLC